MNNKSICRFMLACLAGTGLSFGASADTPRIHVDENDGGENGFSAYMLTSTLWPQTGETFDIPVCWSRSKGQYLPEKEKIRLAVKKAWEDESLVRFQGWGDCGEDPRGIQIGITSETYPAVPHSFLGTGSKYFNPSMVLNLAPGRTHPDYFGGCGAGKRHSDDECAAIIAIHEFGHSLGFTHEQYRPDTPDTCEDKEIRNDRSGVMIGDWDLHSVGNYCNPVWNNNGKLTQTDRAGVKLFYDHLAVADFTNAYVALPVVDYQGMRYSAGLRPDWASVRYTLVDLVATSMLSASAASFDGQTLTIPFLAMTTDGSRWTIVENVTMTFDVTSAQFILTGLQ